MRIHKEGYKTIAITTIILGALNLAFLWFFSASFLWLCILVFMVSIISWLFIISFFRIPSRTLTHGERNVVAPCDGKVVVIEETVDPEYFKEKRLQVSIFMSPANVHVNLNPVSGNVVYSQHHKGKYLVAWNPKSSTENERHSVVIKTQNVEILVKQIAGALAKRIINYLQVGDVVEQNKELGFIKFGSRVDLLLPVGTKLNVKLNQKVKGGVDVIAMLEPQG
jgi:phosphatidylserine decarboxylase